MIDKIKVGSTIYLVMSNKEDKDPYIAKGTVISKTDTMEETYGPTFINAEGSPEMSILKRRVDDSIDIAYELENINATYRMTLNRQGNIKNHIVHSPNDEIDGIFTEKEAAYEFIMKETMYLIYKYASIKDDAEKQIIKYKNLLKKFKESLNS